MLGLKKHGISIRFCEDFKSFNKIIHSLKEYTDDVFYKESLLEELYCAYLRNPNMIHAGRSTVITADCFGNIRPYEKWKFIEGLNNHFGLSVFSASVGGVLYPPEANKLLANKITLNSELFLNICPTSDDIWMCGMAVLNDIKINAVNNSDYLNYINPERVLGISGSTLWLAYNSNGGNDRQLRSLIDHFPIIFERLKKEFSQNYGNRFMDYQYKRPGYCVSLHCSGDKVRYEFPINGEVRYCNADLIGKTDLDGYRHVGHIDLFQLQKRMDSFNEMGILKNKRNKPRIIVSISSHPARMGDAHFSLYSALNQTLKPDEVILNLAEKEFPNKEDDVSPDILKLQRNGLKINWCECIGPYKKIIPSLGAFPDDIIVTLDDDTYYKKDLLEVFYASHCRDRNMIQCHASYQVSFDENGKILDNMYHWRHLYGRSFEPSLLNFIVSSCGVLYPPGVLHHDVLRQDLFMAITPTNDNIWMWGMAVLNGTKIRGYAWEWEYFIFVNPERERNLNDEPALWKINEVENVGNLSRMLHHYPQILEKLKADAEYGKIYNSVDQNDDIK